MEQCGCSGAEDAEGFSGAIFGGGVNEEWFFLCPIAFGIHV